jgi:hypothetical protein
MFDFGVELLLASRIAEDAALPDLQQYMPTICADI